MIFSVEIDRLTFIRGPDALRHLTFQLFSLCLTSVPWRNPLLRFCLGLGEGDGTFPSSFSLLCSQMGFSCPVHCCHEQFLGVTGRGCTPCR